MHMEALRNVGRPGLEIGERHFFLYILIISQVNNLFILLRVYMLPINYKYDWFV